MYIIAHESCVGSSGSNLKWLTCHHFCLLKLTKYLKILSVRDTIALAIYLLLSIYNTITYNYYILRKRALTVNKCLKCSLQRLSLTASIS